MAGVAWYKEYERRREEVLDSKQTFVSRCQALDVHPNQVFAEIRRDIIARIVHESNWQEGLYLEVGRTQELADAVFEDLSDVTGPHIDMDGIVEAHRERVLKFKREGLSVEEVASYNLSFAHVVLGWIANELAVRSTMSLVHALKGFKEIYAKVRGDMPEETKVTIEEGFEIIERMESEERGVYAPMTGSIATEGELIRKLGEVEFERLLHPMHVEYIHFLHRIIMMGTLPSKKMGVFRKRAVHVGDPDVFFASASTIPKLMEEYCKSFPRIMPTGVKYDPIRKAAEASYKFVRIHPYSDGNGRISRLLMNLVVWAHFPPVYLKADKKGRHRYSQALKRANRGDIVPLACLIAIYLKEIYKKLLDAISVV